MDAQAPALSPAPADVRTQAWLRPYGPRHLPGRGGWQLAAGGGGEGAEEGGREQGGRSAAASIRRGSAPASERKESPAPPPRPLLPLLSQQRGVRHRVALRSRVTTLGVTAPRLAAPAWSAGRPQGPVWAGECCSARVVFPVPAAVAAWVETPSSCTGGGSGLPVTARARLPAPGPPRGCFLRQALGIRPSPSTRWGSGLPARPRVILRRSRLLSQNSCCPGY